jgi:hypothetical protein
MIDKVQVDALGNDRLTELDAQALEFALRDHTNHPNHKSRYRDLAPEVMASGANTLTENFYARQRYDFHADRLTGEIAR